MSKSKTGKSPAVILTRAELALLLQISYMSYLITSTPDFIQKLVLCGLIEAVDEDGCIIKNEFHDAYGLPQYRTTPRGEFYVRHLLSIRLPVAVEAFHIPA